MILNLSNPIVKHVLSNTFCIRQTLCQTTCCSFVKYVLYLSNHFVKCTLVNHSSNRLSNKFLSNKFCIRQTIFQPIFSKKISNTFPIKFCICPFISVPFCQMHLSNHFSNQLSNTFCQTHFVFVGHYFLFICQIRFASVKPLVKHFVKWTLYLSNHSSTHFFKQNFKNVLSNKILYFSFHFSSVLSNTVCICQTICQTNLSN